MPRPKLSYAEVRKNSDSAVLLRCIKSYKVSHKDKRGHKCIRHYYKGIIRQRRRIRGLRMHSWELANP